MWNEIKPEDKEKYLELQKIDKERYEKEMAVWNKKQEAKKAEEDAKAVAEGKKPMKKPVAPRKANYFFIEATKKTLKDKKLGVKEKRNLLAEMWRKVSNKEKIKYQSSPPMMLSGTTSRCACMILNLRRLTMLKRMLRQRK